MSQKQIRINNLNSIHGILQQMRAVYREARISSHENGLTVQDAKILTDILKTIGQTTRDSEFEKRLLALEQDR